MKKILICSPAILICLGAFSQKKRYDRDEKNKYEVVQMEEELAKDAKK